MSKTHTLREGTMKTRDGYTKEEAESYYHNTFDENYQPLNGNDSTAFWTPPEIEEILGSPLYRWTIGGIIRRAKKDAMARRFVMQ